MFCCLNTYSLLCNIIKTTISINNTSIHNTMNTNFKNSMKEVMTLAWQFVRKNGYSMSEALKSKLIYIYWFELGTLGNAPFFFS